MKIINGMASIHDVLCSNLLDICALYCTIVSSVFSSFFVVLRDLDYYKVISGDLMSRFLCLEASGKKTSLF